MNIKLNDRKVTGRSSEGSKWEERRVNISKWKFFGLGDNLTRNNKVISQMIGSYLA